MLFNLVPNSTPKINVEIKEFSAEHRSISRAVQMLKNSIFGNYNMAEKVLSTFIASGIFSSFPPFETQIKQALNEVKQGHMNLISMYEITDFISENLDLFSSKLNKKQRLSMFKSLLKAPVEKIISIHH